MANIKCEIVQHIATLATNNAYTKEINVVTWNNNTPCIDIRKWKNDEETPAPLKGITLSDEEVKATIEALEAYLKK